ncbi:hypothetical protein Acsp03_26510 [Actinomadura sp. NBRC 104412]|uniref:hypothetical protein n=1 Tax=Actinomadura sp. NBRC 104412 TaxID=3032203 RepID=UPI0024A5DC75|nr:hypothetical protein [Actinomadura sp. NBRC 104412]GLZ05185.1 hypothetical protein Acsp03_26510 [Actinomadura sp. NBRC 104412]
MSLERTDRGTTLEPTNGDQPKDQAPSNDTPGAPGYPSRLESRARARGETSQTTTEQDPSTDKQSGEQDSRKERQDKTNSSEAADADRSRRPEPSTTGSGESLTPRLDSRRAYTEFFQQPAARENSEAPQADQDRSPIPDRDAKDERADERDQRPGEDHELREPEARGDKRETTEPQGELTRLPETSDGAPRLGREHPAPEQDARELPASSTKPEPTPEGTRGTDGSWNTPQEPAEVTDEREPRIPEQRPDRETAPPVEPAIERQAESSAPQQAENTDQPQQPAPDEHTPATDEPPQEHTGQSDQPEPVDDGAVPGREHREPSTEVAEPQEPAIRDDSPFRAQAYVGEDGEVKWVLMPDLELEGPGYEGPRSADRGDPLQPVDEETDLGRDPEKPKRLGDLLRSTYNNPDDAQKFGNKAMPGLNDIFKGKPPEGHPGTVKDTRPTMQSPQDQTHYGDAGFAMLAGVVVIGALWNWTRDKIRDRTTDDGN